MEVGRPGRPRAWPGGGADGGDRLAAEGEHAVAAGVRSRGLELPAEEGAVEGSGGPDVGDGEVDPDGGSGHVVRGEHGFGPPYAFGCVAASRAGADGGTAGPASR